MHLAFSGSMAHNSVPWDIEKISFEVVAEMTDHPVVTVTVNTPAGVLMFVAEPVEVDGWLILRGTHVQGVGPNVVGMENLMLIAQAVIERMECDGLVVEGALRTTGANPGRRPRDIRFARRARPEPSPRKLGP